MKESCSEEKRKKRRLEWLFLLGVFLFFFLWSCTQRFNFSADESMRYQVVQYIYEHGSLPRGDEPSIRNEDWGISYAFNPIIAYMGSAALMKVVSIFTTDEWILLIAARFMNVLLGTLMVWTVRKTAKLLFSEKYAWMFTCLVAFLPSNVILYSYVNCDALAMCSSAIIFYAWVLAAKQGWSWKNCAVLAVGMGFCLLSYYNAYGYVLVSFFYFVAMILLGERKGNRWKELFSRGAWITLIVCAIALWWFIRNAILYDGDIFARQASHECAELYAREKYKPSNVVTFQEDGQSMLSMIFYRPIFLEHSWLVTVLFSFVGAFGYNKIYLSKWIIVPYLLFLLAGLVFMLVYRKPDFYLKKDEIRKREQIGGRKVLLRVTSGTKTWKVQGMMSWAFAAAMLIPNFLNAYYSYSSDFQAQGRYSMPMLFPLMYFVTKGCEAFFEEHEKLKKLEKAFCILVSVMAVVLAVFTWARLIYPLYLQNYYGLR
ncbi:MAG: glycosyltransferase family 39 protein [Fusicatenibacter sp.]|nr:glycosyltransferase family 39 protein [Lachnospiraceae bacterium]MDY2939131.1 glycosyltransferase family 39 protein [Fusicatenibacter sp.]